MSSRLFCVGVDGTALNAGERAILAARPPWGVILFRRNIESAAQLARLIGEVRGLGVPYLFLDQEGGPVDRLKDLLAPAPSFQRAARAGQARRAGDLAGASLALLGFDVDLAPVVDRGLPGAGALVLGERCASEDAGEVIHAAGEFLAGLHAAGIGGCLKHFPGLGRARLDTHRELPVLEANPHQEALDLSTFGALADKARAIMMSHAAGPDGVPASLSDVKTTMLLRDRVGFEGAAFSDDLEMGALDAFGDLPQRCVRAAAAGCDLLLVCKRLEEYPACAEAVERSVPAARREEAAARLDDYARHLSALRRGAVPSGPTLAGVADALRAFPEA